MVMTPPPVNDLQNEPESPPTPFPSPMFLFCVLFLPPPVCDVTCIGVVVLWVWERCRNREVAVRQPAGDCGWLGCGSCEELPVERGDWFTVHVCLQPGMTNTLMLIPWHHPIGAVLC